MNLSSLFVVSGPSGVGKTSLVKALTDSNPALVCPVSYTTRPPRPGEVQGVNYHFVDADEFQQMVGNDEFLEHAEVFGNRYGTARQTVQQQLELGKTLLLEIDWQGAAQARKLFPDATTVMILPPSIKGLRQRLQNRQQDDEETIEQRMLEATQELSHYGDFDYLIINEIFDAALIELESVLTVSHLRSCALADEVKRLLPELDGL